MKHTKKCKCNTCYLTKKFKLKGTKFGDGALLHITRELRKLVIKNLCFKPQKRGRFEGYKLITREFRHDEWFTVFPYTFQLINCKLCKSLTKAPLTRKRWCFRCENTFRHSSPLHSVEWQTWGIVA